MHEWVNSSLMNLIVMSQGAVVGGHIYLQWQDYE